MAQEQGHGSREARPVFEIDGNRLTLLPQGPARLRALHALIAEAQRQLDLYFYIFGHDECAIEVREALIDACNRGVAVTLMIDAFGSATSPSAQFEPLIAAGARFGWFGARRTTRYLIRNHQKMVIADGGRAMVGGFNVTADYFAPEDDRNGWRDVGLLVEGPLVAELQRWFDALAEWTLDTKQSFRALRRMIRDWRPGVGQAVWLMGGPTRHLNGWARHLKQDLQAGRRLDIAAAYFSPGWAMVRRLGRLARAGSARIVTAARSDNMA
ncbi:MAG: cardiolipin synthase B, partial [Sphingobium sp.]|nr:cardiolipin synthase B [Sphingobium sp.]